MYLKSYVFVFVFAWFLFVCFPQALFLEKSYTPLTIVVEWIPLYIPQIIQKKDGDKNLFSVMKNHSINIKVFG